MLNDIAENRFVSALVQSLRRSPLQANGLYETDAEIIRLRDTCTLAVTTDSIAEEIALGLYDDPWLIGWMAVMVNLSDLAAVGAQPLGVVISEILPPDYPHESTKRLQLGVHDACETGCTFVLGGDTNFGQELTITGTAFGECPEGMFLSRVGCAPGDRLYASHSLGSGNAFALSFLSPLRAGRPKPVRPFYRPSARLKEGSLLHGLASSCMDTSDGVLATLDQMMRLNSVGFDLGCEWTEALHPEVREAASAAGISPWLFLAGQHGEFELLFTVPDRFRDELFERASASGWQPLPLGRVVPQLGISLVIQDKRVVLDTARIRNIPGSEGNTIEKSLSELLSIDEEIQKGEIDHAVR